MDRVLIVEDEAPVRRLLERWAAGDDMEIVGTGSAEEALDIAAAGPVAVAFCDYHLPGKDGIWLARRFREIQPDTAVVMATGTMDTEIALSGLHAGAIDYLAKPFTRERMAQALRWALHTYRSRLAQARDRGDDPTLTNHIAAVMSMIRLHNAEAHGHARRVAQIARELAMALNVRPPALDDIERAALLHDLASDSLLDIAPEGSVDWEEIAQLPSLRELLAVARFVHEPYDADRRDVPLAARIIAVAETYDDLVRSGGGSAESSARAVEILSTERVLEFDPSVIAALRGLRIRAA